MIFRTTFAIVLSFVFASTLLAQGTKADYERAANLRGLTRGQVLNENVEAQWLPDGEHFWYRSQQSGGAAEFILVDVKSGQRRSAFDHEKLAAALSKELKRKVDPHNLPIQAIERGDGDTIVVNAVGRCFAFDEEDSTLSEREEKLPRPQPSRKTNDYGDARQRDARRSNRSPDGKWRIHLNDGDVVLSPQNGEAARLTDGEKLHAIHTYWSPDSSRVAVLQIDPEQQHTVYTIESSPRDQVQPKLKSQQYLKPGDRITRFTPRLFDIEARHEIAIDNSLFDDPWEIHRLRWAEDSSRFTFVYNARGHGVLRLVAVDAKSGEATTVVEDAPETFVDYAHKQFAYFLDATDESIWMSERDGWNHLYLFDSKSSELKNRITAGEWVVREVEHVDIEQRQIWFRAGGIVADQDPYHIHFCRVNFDGTNLVRLTDGDGTHDVRFSPDRHYFIDRFSRVDLPPVHVLRRASDGKLVCELEVADIAGLHAIEGWRMPERFVAKGRDDATDIWGIIHRPTNFNANQRYPVIEKIYAGPHDHHVPKRFHASYSAQQIAELGFIVVQIDGMGTSWRSKKFHDVCHRNLKDAGFPDRIKWLRAAAEQYPYIDLARVGIYGGSAGGQNALGALLFHPDFYHVAVADCGCHDNRMDKIWWNEAWMGKFGPHYAENSNVTHAKNLQGKLLLTVGELDRNVDPASTMQVVNALIQADKDFDLLVMPGVGHGAGETRYAARRRQDFFVRHLLKVEPRRDRK